MKSIKKYREDRGVNGHPVSCLHSSSSSSSRSQLGPSRRSTMACLQRLQGLVSLRSWSVLTPTSASTTRTTSSVPTKWTIGCQADLGMYRTLCAGVPVRSEPSYVTEYWHATSSDEVHIGGRPVRADISAFVTCWDQCMCKIWRWHFVWNASSVFSWHETNVQVSADQNKADITRACEAVMSVVFTARAKAWSESWQRPAVASQLRAWSWYLCRHWPVTASLASVHCALRRPRHSLRPRLCCCRTRLL